MMKLSESLLLNSCSHLLRDKSRKTTVVIALRADFYSHCAQYPLLRQAVAAEQEYIGQMTGEELRRAIEEPAKRGGWEFEPGLVDVLLQDIGAQGTRNLNPVHFPCYRMHCWLHGNVVGDAYLHWRVIAPQAEYAVQ